MGKEDEGGGGGAGGYSSALPPCTPPCIGCTPCPPCIGCTKFFLPERQGGAAVGGGWLSLLEFGGLMLRVK